MNDPVDYDFWTREIRELGRAFNLLVFILGNHGVRKRRAKQLAEDALQEGITRVLAKENPNWKSYLHFENTVIRTARNVLIDQHRKKHEQQFPSETEWHPETPSSRPFPELELIRDCLNQLPEEHRKVLEMVYDDGFRLHEVANSLQLSAPTLEGQVSAAVRLRTKALQALREEYLRRESELEY